MRSRIIVIVLSIVVAMAAVALVVSAGDPDNPPGPPETTNSYTLEDIYDRLDTGVDGTQSTFTEPSEAPPTGTMHTLNDIIAAAPQADDTDGAAASQVPSGKTYWSLRNGAWGLQTGTAGVGDNVIGNEGQLIFIIPDGFYTGSRTATAQDTDLTAGNIRSGVNLFGVAGNPYVANTVSGDAAAGDIVSGRLAWVDGSELTGIRALAPLRKTGQTASYATGDDGALETGAAWPIPRFITGTTGIVTDTLTGLVWLENANCFERRNWSQAVSDANTLNSGECGLSDGSAEGDWRLPSAQEHQSLVHYGVFNPAVPNTAGTGKWTTGDPFTAIQSDGYWTSSTMAGGTDYAWCMPMGDGSVRGYVKTLTYYVWPVRGGQ